MTASATYKKNEELLKLTLSKYPLGFGEPEDIANACAYLLSDASRWVTGTELVLDGGYTAQ
jgi:NAD(P)-dependent dehydrogenase (short-subunit alcohol dehydrogenase family)